MGDVSNPSFIWLSVGFRRARLGPVAGVLTLGSSAPSRRSSTEVAIVAVFIASPFYRRIVVTPLTPEQSVLVMGILSIVYCTMGGITSCFVAGYLVSLLTPPTKKDLSGLTIYTIRKC